MNQQRVFKVAAVLLVVFGTLSVIYIQTAKPVYQSTASVLIRRSQIDTSSLNNTMRDNRWIWIKDGLSLRNEILTDTYLKSLLQRQWVKEEYQSVDNLKHQIKLVYSGGDSDTYEVTVFGSRPAISRDLALLIINRIQTLPAEKLNELFSASIASLERQLAALDSSEQEEWRKNLIQLKLQKNMLVAEAKARPVVLDSPKAADSKRWPKNTAIFGLALLLSLASAGFFELSLQSVGKFRR